MSIRLAIGLFLTSFISGKLLRELPGEFTDSTNIVWIDADQFTLPWQFSRTTTGIYWAFFYFTDTTYHQANYGIPSPMTPRQRWN